MQKQKSIKKSSSRKVLKSYKLKSKLLKKCAVVESLKKIKIITRIALSLNFRKVKIIIKNALSLNL